MKTNVFLFLAVVFSLLSLLYFAGCTAGGGFPNSTSGAGISVLSGYVYKPAEGQSKGIKAAQNTGLIASSGQLYDANYTPVKNATVKREDSPANTTQTDSNGRFSFSNLSAAGEYNIVIDPSTSTNATTYAGVTESFAAYNTSNSSAPAYLKVVPVTTTVPLGKKREFRVIMKDGNANVIPPCAVTWSVESGIGTITSAGICTAVTAGEGRVVATYGDLTAYSSVTVIGSVQNETGTLQGTVTDGSSPIKSVIISVGGISTTGITDASGSYTIPQIPVGNYYVSAIQNGSVVSTHEVSITAGATTQCNFTITPTPTPTVSPWKKCYGGSNWDYAYSAQQTSDGGYIIAGTTASNNGDVSGNHSSNVDYWVVKLNSAGTIQWQKCLGGTSSEHAFSIKQTSDSGYVVVGCSRSTDGDVVMPTNHYYDYWVVKLDLNGAIQWQKCLGGPGGQSDAFSIQQTSDGGYVVVGTTYTSLGDVTGGGHHGWDADYWVIKLNSSGAIQWQKCFGGSGKDYGKSIQQTSDGGYIVGGSTNSNDGDVSANHGDYDYWVIKINSSGTLQWQKCLGGTGKDGDRSDGNWEGSCVPVQQTSDGGYIVAGYAKSNDGDISGNHGVYDAWIVKLDSIGNITWQKSLGGTGNDYAYSIQQTSDSGYVVAGCTYSNDGDVSGNHGNGDYWLIKLNSTGIIQWQKCFGGNSIDDGRSVQQTSDDGYIFAGYTNSTNGDVSGNHGSSDFWVVKLNSSGE